jgi:hypothetical protein
VPLALSDDGVATGTVYLKTGGSLALQATATQASPIDLCGTNGAADQTIVLSASPYSSKEFLLAACGPTQYTLYYIPTRTMTALVPPGFRGGFAGVSNDGTLVGFCCAGSGGSAVFVDRGGTDSFYSGYILGFGISSKDTFWFGSQDTCLATTYVYTAKGMEAVAYRPGGLPFYTWPVQANSRGQVIGNYSAACGNFRQPALPFFWSPGYRTGTFFSPPAGLNVTTTWLVALNERGWVAGNTTAEPFLWNPLTGQTVSIPTPAGVTNFFVAAMNNHGAVTGTYLLGGSTVPFIAFCRGTDCPGR